MQNQKGLEYYENISQVTLYSFKGVIDNSDYRYLLKSGELPEISVELEEELAEAWFNIYNEYSEITGDSSASLQFNETKRQTVKKHKINYLTQLLRTIYIYPDSEIIEILKDDGINIDLEDLKYSLDLAVGKLSKMQLQLKRSETEQEENTGLDFMITELERFQGYQFDEKKMTVKKFAYIVKRYKQNGRQNK